MQACLNQLKARLILHLVLVGGSKGTPEARIGYLSCLVGNKPSGKDEFVLVEETSSPRKQVEMERNRPGEEGLLFCLKEKKNFLKEICIYPNFVTQNEPLRG